MQYVASDGRKVQLFPEYFNFKKGYPYGFTSFKDFVEKGQGKYIDTDGFFYNKLSVANSVEEILKYLKLPRKFSMHVDLCSGPAILPRALKARGVCDYIEATDLIDRSNDYPLDRSKILWRNAIVDEEKYMLAVDAHLNISGQIIGKIHAFNYIEEIDDVEWDKFKLDQVVESDLYDYDPGYGFDLVTLISGIEYFRSKEFFRKVYSILNPGGVLVTSNISFYELFAGSMSLPMDAPWLHARLHKSDLFRYYYEFHSDLYEYVKRAYYFPTTHYVLEDFIDDAMREGFSHIYSARHPSDANQNFIKNNYKFFKQVIPYTLQDARKINERVTINDLLSSHWTLVLVK